MVTEKVIEEVTNAVQREAGKRNLVLNVGATRSGWAIRHHVRMLMLSYSVLHHFILIIVKCVCFC